MNRAHAYKDKVAKNLALGEDSDSNVNMGLYCYPCLMDADILMFNANVVPVGKDQNSMSNSLEISLFVLIKIWRNTHCPRTTNTRNNRCDSGLDGRKMSKSYDNTIEIF